MAASTRDKDKDRGRERDRERQRDIEREHLDPGERIELSFVLNLRGPQVLQDRLLHILVVQALHHKSIQLILAARSAPQELERQPVGSWLGDGGFSGFCDVRSRGVSARGVFGSATCIRAQKLKLSTTVLVEHRELVIVTLHQASVRQTCFERGRLGTHCGPASYVSEDPSMSSVARPSNNFK